MNIRKEADLFLKLAQVAEPVKKEILTLIDNVQSALRMSSPLLWMLKSQVGNIDPDAFMTHLESLKKLCEQHNLTQFIGEIDKIVAQLKNSSTPTTEKPNTSVQKPAPKTKQTTVAKPAFNAKAIINKLNEIKKKIYDDTVSDPEVKEMFGLLDQLLNRRSVVERDQKLKDEYDLIQSTLDVFAHIHESLFMKNERDNFQAFKAKFNRAD